MNSLANRGTEMELHGLYGLLARLAKDTQRSISGGVMFEPAGGSDTHKEKHLRLHHYKVPNGHPQVVAWGRVMPNGPRKAKPRGPCARVSILSKLLDGDDPSVSCLECDPSGDWGTGHGEMYGYIYEANDRGYHCVVHALTMACMACLKKGST